MTMHKSNICARHKRTCNVISPLAYLPGRVRYDPLMTSTSPAIRRLVVLSSLKGN